VDFSFTTEQADVAGLAATIFQDGCTPDRLKAVDAGPERFDRALWKTISDAGLTGLTLPEEHGGSGLGVLEMCSVLVEAGRTVAPVPLATHVPVAMTIAAFGTPDQAAAWVAPAATGDRVLTAAIAEEHAHTPARPSTTAKRSGDAWQLTGTKVAVPSGTVADLFLVLADTGADTGAGTRDGTTAFLVRPDDAGVTVTPQQFTDGDVVARLELDGAVVPAERVLGEVDGGDAVSEHLLQRLLVAACAQAHGTVQGALLLTAAYARTREQFGRPIGTFQAVSQRLADGYIDVLGAELTLWQAAWRLSEGMPADLQLATAKLWAADACHKLAHTTVHVHGGVGIDMDGEAHRYFTAAKRLEFTFGGTTDQARRIGAALAAEPA
jgi:alkylation response protein AidB-like acyl-CoA dehydrogenase